MLALCSVSQTRVEAALPDALSDVAVVLPAQSSASDVDTSFAHTHGMLGFIPFEPTSFQVQSRWRPTDGDSIFYANRWRNFTFGVSTGLDVSSNWHSFNKQIPFQAFLGYRITPIHELRVQGGYEEVEVQGSETRTSLMGELQWLANLSNFSAGYKPDRVVSISTLLAVGGRYYQTGLPYRLVPYARAGFDASFRLSPNVNFFVQPYLGASREQHEAFNTSDHSKFNLLYGVHAGIAANLRDSRQYYANMAPMYRTFFFEANTGWGFNLKDFDTHHSGNTGWVGIGRWLAPMMGFRLGGMAQQNYWWSDTNGETNYYRHNVSMAARAELLFNLNNLKAENRQSQKDPTWEFDLSAGFQYGYNAKTEGRRDGSNWRTFSYGLTTALQALYKVSPGSYIFVEPRFYNSIYNEAYYDDRTGESVNQDRFVTLNIGTRVYVAPRSVRRQNDNIFSRNVWLGAGLGGMKMFESSRAQMDGFSALQPAFSLNLGYDAHPLATIRLQGEWSMLGRVNGGLQTRYQMLDLRAMYMLPFSNLIRGVDSHNRFHTYLEAGPTASVIVGQHTNDVGNNHRGPLYRVGRRTLGAMGGVLVSYDVTPRWDIYAEAQGQYNRNTGFMPGAHPRLNNLRWGLYGGVRYHFHHYTDDERQRWATDMPSWMRGWFIEGSTGWVGPLSGSTHNGLQGGSWAHRSGQLFNLNFGHWFTPYLGARIGLQAQQHSSATHEYESQGVSLTGYDASAFGGATLELLTNPLNYSKRGRLQHDRRFDLNLSLGFMGGYLGMGDGREDAGRILRRTVGLFATIQPLFRVSPGVWLYAEPRYSTLHYSASGIYNSVYPRGIMHDIAFSAGTRIVRPDSRSLRQAEQLEAASASLSDVFEPHWWVGMQIGGTRNLVNRKFAGNGYGVPIQPVASLNAGYDFHPLATLRGQFEYGRMGRLNLGSFNTSHNDLYNLRLIYMLNMTNLWRSTRTWPRLSVYPEVGVAYSHHSGSSTESHIKHDEKRDAFGMMLGAMAAYRVNDSWDATVETQEQYHLPLGFMPGQSYHKLGNGSWNITAGVRYHIAPGSVNDIQWQSFTPQWQRGWFVEGGYGMDVPLYTGSSFAQVVGNSWQASFGHWFSSLLGFRAGMMGSRTYWGSEAVTDYTGHQLEMSRSNMLLGARIEALVNPLNFSLRHRHAAQAPVFDLNLSVGLDFGAQVRCHTANAEYSRQGYVGFTASAQTLLRVARGAQLFIEPRYHTASYKVPDAWLLTNSRNTDKYFDLSLGARITRGDASTRASQKDDDDDIATGIADGRLWVGIDLSDMKQLHCQSGKLSKYGVQPGLGVSVGYDVHPLASFKMQFKYDYLRINQPDFISREDLYNLRALYMLNFTNLWQGTRTLRPRVSAYLEAGPTFSHYDHRSSLGMALGANVAVRASRHWDVTFESLGQYNLRTPYLPTVDRARPSNLLMEFGIGTRYHF